MKKTKKLFAQRVKDLRKLRKLTQLELAELCGLSVGFVSNLERGINTPSFAVLVLISKALNVQVKDLFDFGNN